MRFECAVRSPACRDTDTVTSGRDPFYRRCAATGQGLAKAVAGAKTGFTVACADILGQPAIGALVRTYPCTINPFQ